MFYNEILRRNFSIKFLRQNFATKLYQEILRSNFTTNFYNQILQPNFTTKFYNQILQPSFTTKFYDERVQDLLLCIKEAQGAEKENRVSNSSSDNLDDFFVVY